MERPDETARRASRAPARRAPRWAGLAWPVVALVVLLAPGALAAAAPAFAPLPPPRPAAAIPPLPAPAPDARPSLDGIVDPLPLVVRDLPDEASRVAVADWDAASLTEPQDAAAMLDHAWQGLRYKTEGGDALLAYANYLIFGGSALGADDLAKGAPSAEALVAMAALTHDPRNADRLINFAVALFAIGVTNDLLTLGAPHTPGEPLTTLYEAELLRGEGRLLQYHAVELLAAVEHAFGPHRAARLNAAYFLNAMPAGVNGSAAALPFVDRQLAADPADRTARLLLGSIQARRIDVRDGLDRALSILAPLAADPAAGPLADVAVGDAHLAAASVRPEAPFLARHLARRALAAYDRALGATTDPGVYAGRAAALALLGAPAEAVAAQRVAVERAPGSLPLRLELAALQEAVGDFAGMGESAAAAMDLVEAGWAPPLRTVRFVPAPATPESGVFSAGDRGYLGFSYGSDRDRAGIFRVPEGGAFVVSLDLIPRTNAPNLDDWRRGGPAPTVAVQVATAAAVLLGQTDPAGVRTPADPATLLAAGQPLPPDADPKQALETAETVLRHAGRFAEAAALCRRALAAPPAAGFDRIPALLCAGEATYLAAFARAAARPCLGALDCQDARKGGPVAELQAAAADLAMAYDEAVRRIYEPFVPGRSLPLSIELLRLRALQAAQAAGQTERARHLATLAIANTDDSPLSIVVGAAKLGELELEAGDIAGAAQTYDLTLAMLQEADDRVWTSGIPEFALLARSLEQRAHINRGIARLRLAQTDPLAPPDCTGAHRPLCEGARLDFAAALAGDGRNPVALLNAGWAARLLGDRTAARDLLALASEVDPSLFPALNDLGVLAAEEGDLAAARDAFRGALAVAPDYDLAAWNLGVLELRRGFLGLLSGQGWLLRALAHSPSFRGHELAFKTDERVYRVAFGPNARLGHDWSFGRAYSLAAVALGSITLLAAVAHTLNSVLLGKLSDAIADVGRDRLGRAGDFLGAGFRRRIGRGPVGRRWEAWGPWLVSLPVLALVTAWPAWRDDPALGVAAAALALFAAAVAAAAHEVGHALAARWAGARLVPAQWGPGVALALLLLPLRLSSAPYVGQRVVGVAAGRAWWVYLGGPAANLMVAVAAYALFLAQPVPLLRLVAEVQLAAVGYALLPFDPLDGGPLAARRPGLVAAVALLVAVAGVLFALGML